MDTDFSARQAHSFGHAVLRDRPGAAVFNDALLRSRPGGDAPPASVLLIEDDPNDVLLMRRALHDALGAVDVVTAPSTSHARARISAGEIRPDLILVGIEPRLGDVAGFLTWLGDGSGLPALPVVLLLSLDVPARQLLGGAAGPCRRLIRPLGFDALVHALNRALPPLKPD